MANYSKQCLAWAFEVLHVSLRHYPYHCRFHGLFPRQGYFLPFQILTACTTLNLLAIRVSPFLTRYKNRLHELQMKAGNTSLLSELMSKFQHSSNSLVNKVLQAFFRSFLLLLLEWLPSRDTLQRRHRLLRYRLWPSITYIYTQLRSKRLHSAISSCTQANLTSNQSQTIIEQILVGRNITPVGEVTKIFVVLE